DLKPERLCSLKIDDQLEFGRLFHRKVARFSSLQDLVYVRSHASAIVLYARSIRHKPSGLYKSSVLVNGWQMLRCRELDDSLPITQSERIHKGQQRVREILAERCERTIEIGGRPPVRGGEGHPQGGGAVRGRAGSPAVRELPVAFAGLGSPSPHRWRSTAWQHGKPWVRST